LGSLSVEVTRADKCGQARTPARSSRTLVVRRGQRRTGPDREGGTKVARGDEPLELAFRDQLSGLLEPSVPYVRYGAHRMSSWPSLATAKQVGRIGRVRALDARVCPRAACPARKRGSPGTIPVSQLPPALFFRVSPAEARAPLDLSPER